MQLEKMQVRWAEAVAALGMRDGAATSLEEDGSNWESHMGTSMRGMSVKQACFPPTQTVRVCSTTHTFQLQFNNENPHLQQFNFTEFPVCLPRLRSGNLLTKTAKYSTELRPIERENTAVSCETECDRLDNAPLEPDTQDCNDSGH